MTAADERHFFRQVTSVLIVERDPPSAPSGDPAQAVQAAIALLRRGGGDAEPLGTDAVVAVFDPPTAAVQAATRLHLATRSGDVEGTTWRAGLAVGDVRMTSEGSASRAAIDRAAELARLARPGTTAVLASARPALGRLRNARLELIDGGIPDGPVQLVIPHRPDPVARRRALLLLAGAAALGGVGSVVWIAAHRARRDREHRLTLGVGVFRSSGGGEAPGWIGPALRDGLNTQLSELTGVRVFSDEFMDFLMNREHLTAIEVANRLGIEKMVSGTVVVIGDRVQVEARIIDVATGVFEGAYVTGSRQQDFLALEQDLVLGVIGKLHLRLSAEDERRLAARRTTNLDALRRLLEAEQQTPEKSPEVEPERTPEPHSSPWLGPRVAWADDAEAEILTFLEEYRRATEARDVTALGALYVDFTTHQRESLERFFHNVQSLRVKIERVEVAVVGDEAVVSYTRVDDFVDVPTEAPQHVSVRLTKTLRRVDGRWRFAAAR